MAASTSCLTLHPFLSRSSQIIHLAYCEKAMSDFMADVWWFFLASILLLRSFLLQVGLSSHVCFFRFLPFRLAGWLVFFCFTCFALIFSWSLCFYDELDSTSATCSFRFLSRTTWLWARRHRLYHITRLFVYASMLGSITRIVLVVDRLLWQH